MYASFNNEFSPVKSPRYITVQTPDGKNRVWIAMPDAQGCVKLNCSFSLRGLMAMVDELDTLPYARVVSVSDIDADCSGLLIALNGHPQGTLARLIDDLCEIMHKYETLNAYYHEE